MENGWRKVPNWKCLLVNSEKGLFLSVCVDDIKMARKKENLDPMWKILNKEVDFGEPTSFRDHVYFGCLNPGCQLVRLKNCLIQKNLKQTCPLLRTYSTITQSRNYMH